MINTLYQNYKLINKKIKDRNHQIAKNKISFSNYEFPFLPDGTSLSPKEHPCSLPPFSTRAFSRTTPQRLSRPRPRDSPLLPPRTFPPTEVPIPEEFRNPEAESTADDKSRFPI